MTQLLISRNGLNLIVMKLLTKKYIYRSVLTLITAAALTGAVIIYAWLNGAFLPRWILWEEKNIQHSTETEEPLNIQLKKRCLIVQRNHKTIWESPKDIMVQNFLWCDINHDGQKELILLCWRIGRYGNARPYWIEKDEKKWSQHIYIYEYRNEEIHPIWMASDIGMDVVTFEFSEKKRLIITETSGRQTSWDWLSWGLTYMYEIH